MSKQMQRAVKSKMRRVPAEIEAVLEREADRVGSEPSKVMRWLLVKAIRAHTPLPKDLVLT